MTFPELPKPSVPQTPLNHQQNLFRSSEHQDHNLNSHNTQQAPASAIQETATRDGHGRTSSNNSGLLSPNDASLQWPLDKVLVWLAIQGFSNDWQETFRGLNIHGSDFLDLGRGNNGRGNFGMMHQLIYPKLARECGKSGSGWNSDRERNEGRRMRRLVRKIVEGTENAPGVGHQRRDSTSVIASASTEGNVENSPNAMHQDGFSHTPSTAGGGEDSPGRHFHSPMPASIARPPSKTRSSTVPISTQGQSSTPANECGPEAGAVRSGYTRGILNNINDAATRRHSPSASSDTGTSSLTTTLTEAIRAGYDASPQSGSPAAQHVMLSSASNGGAVSAPPYGRASHRKTESTDSIISNSNNPSFSIDRSSDRRNGSDNHRPPSADAVGKHAATDAPASAKELSKGFLDRFRKRRKEESSHASPEESNLESPTSPLNFRHAAHGGFFTRNGLNGSSTSLERPSSASNQLSDHERLRDRARARSTGGKRYALVTPDQWNYRLVDITEADTADAMRECICKALNYTDHDMAQIHLTEPGQIDHDEPLSDSLLMTSKNTKGDGHGNLKFFVRRGPVSASLAPPQSAGVGLSPKASPPAGSLFPRKALDEEGYARLRSSGRTRSKSPPGAHSSETPSARSFGPKRLDIPESASQPADTFNTGTAKERMRSMLFAKDSSNLSDAEWVANLEAAIEDYRVEMEKQGKEFHPRRQSRFSNLSSPGLNSGGVIRRSGEINFDEPRESPYDNRKPEPLVPLRKPPAPPPGSVMLEKANSLTRKTGDSLRSSLGSQSDLMNRRSAGETLAEESDDKGRRKATASTPSVSAGIGSALVGVGDVSSVIGKPVGSRRNLPLREINEQRQGDHTSQNAMHTGNYGWSGYGRDNMSRCPLFQIV